MAVRVTPCRAEKKLRKKVSLENEVVGMSQQDGGPLRQKLRGMVL